MTARSSKPVFVGRTLDCVRGERPVFSGLDFALAPGGALLLRGPNGSGKSSLIRILTGLLRPAAGSLEWDGAPIAEDPEAHRMRLHYVGHLDGVKPALTVAENLAFWAGLRHARGTVPGALARFGLSRLAETPARYLSAGQRRRLALARMLTGHIPLWLLDEPTVTLDEEATATLKTALAEHRARAGMVVLATHGPLDLHGAEVIEMAGFARTPEVESF